jgi:NADPH:quinone reductase-like Zn-dependent oxidoreductase
MPGGFLQPQNKILGADIAGRVEAIGRHVKLFKPGDDVFGYLPSATGRGTFAEYVCANENALALKPANLTFEQAATVPLAAVQVLPTSVSSTAGYISQQSWTGIPAMW